MTTHQLYVGGPVRPNGQFGRSQFPAVAFDNTQAVFQNMPVAAHHGGVFAALTRTLDFGRTQGRPNDPALLEYINNSANTAIAAADVLNLQVIPANTLLFGLYAAVETLSGTTGSLTFALDDGTTFGAAVNINATFNKMAAPNGAWVSAGAVSLATANFSNVPRMLQATVTTLSTNFGNLRISVSPILASLQTGQY